MAEADAAVGFWDGTALWAGREVPRREAARRLAGGGMDLGDAAQLLAEDAARGPLGRADFGRSQPGDWEPHVLTRGPRKGQQVWKNAKTGAYRDEPPAEPGAGKKGKDKGGPGKGGPGKDGKGKDKPKADPSVLPPGGVKDLVADAAAAQEKYIRALDICYPIKPEEVQKAAAEIGVPEKLRPDFSMMDLAEYVYHAARTGDGTKAAADAVEAVRKRREGLLASQGLADLSVPPAVGREAALESVRRLSAEGMKGLPAARRAEYAASMKAVCSRLPERAAERLAANLTALRYAPDLPGVYDRAMASLKSAAMTKPEVAQELIGRVRPQADALAASGQLPAHAHQALTALFSDPHRWREAGGVAADLVAKLDEERRGHLGGCYNTKTGEVVIDGGIKETTHDGPAPWRMTVGDSRQGLYAHELTHAIDGPDKEVSSSAAWRDIWSKEIAPASALTSYASSVPHEGLAEFGRLVYGGQASLADAEASFPRACKFFRDHGLWPKS